MEHLLAFINNLPPALRPEFAKRCGTSEGYLRKVCSTGQSIGEKLAINIERESAGVITCESLRPDVDWAYLRKTCRKAKAA